MLVHGVSNGSGCSSRFSEPQDVNSAVDQLNQKLSVLAARDAYEVSDYAIGPQDVIEVNLFNIGSADGIPNKIQVRVSNEGMVNLPLLGQVQAGGQTRTQLEASLRKQYEKFMHEPDVGVALAENRSNSVYLLGAVKSPGVVPVTGQETLRRLLATAGGLTKDAGMFVHLSRHAGDREQAYVVSLDELANDRTGKVNLHVRPGDFINVPVAGTFYVDGHVNRPNAYPLVGQYTLSQAVAIAGGVDDFGKTSDISIFRHGPNGEVSVLNCDLRKIRSGEQEDVRIAANDLILVPPSTGKMIISTPLGVVGYTSRSGSGSVSVGRGNWRTLPIFP